MRFGASRLLWVLLFGVVFLTFGADQASAETGLASWYGPGFVGNTTASGEPYNPNAYTVAHKTLPLGTQLNVSYEGSSVQVRVNDRGPYVGDRTLDLSRATAETLGLKQAGVDYVTYTHAGESASTVTPEHSTSTSETGYSGAQVEQGGGEYVVQSGDTLWGISQELGVSVDQLANANGIEDPSLIYSGTVLHY